ncbi:hypothetical protein ACOZZ1_000789 [Vibrio fluvialis]|nr:hypothetical protein [Vibrio fluvialis]
MREKLLLVLKDRKTLFVFCCMFMSLPLFLYAYQFGFGLWSEHNDWAQMGSALGGIYSPVFALATILLLYKQYHLQRKISKSQDLITICSDSKSEAIYLLTEIKSVILNSEEERAQNFYEALQRYRFSGSDEDYEYVWRKHRMETLLLKDLFYLLHNLRCLKHPYAKSTLNSLKRKTLGQLSIELCLEFEHYFGSQFDDYELIIHEYKIPKK